MFRASKYFRRFENNHSLAAKPPTRKTDLKKHQMVSGVSQNAYLTVMGIEDACCCFLKASIISLMDGSKRSATTFLK